MHKATKKKVRRKIKIELETIKNVNKANVLVAKHYAADLTLSHPSQSRDPYEGAIIQMDASQHI